MARMIDKAPPSLSGNTRQDLQAMVDYLAYLREQMNFILAQLAKAGSGREE